MRLRLRWRWERPKEDDLQLVRMNGSVSAATKLSEWEKSGAVGTPPQAVQEALCIQFGAEFAEMHKLGFATAYTLDLLGVRLESWDSPKDGESYYTLLVDMETDAESETSAVEGFLDELCAAVNGVNRADDSNSARRNAGGCSLPDSWELVEVSPVVHNTDAGRIEADKPYIIRYQCRDIGYGVEEGFLYGRWTGEVDYVGKLTIVPDKSPSPTIYLFPDEIVELERCEPNDDYPADGVTLDLGCFGIVVTLGKPDAEGVRSGKITSDLRVDESEYTINRAIDGIESLVLAHAVAGIDVTSSDYVAGIETAVEAVMNNA